MIPVIQRSGVAETREVKCSSARFGEAAARRPDSSVRYPGGSGSASRDEAIKPQLPPASDLALR